VIHTERLHAILGHMGIIFAIIAAILQAVGFVVLKRSYKEFPPSVAFFFITIFGLLVWIPYAFWVGFSFEAFPLVFVYALVSTILAQAFAVYILSKGDISITGSIFATYPIYTVILSFLINHRLTSRFIQERRSSKIIAGCVANYRSNCRWTV